jgi:CBS domain-containing protein
MTRAPDIIGEIMTREVVTVSARDTVERALQVMVEHDIGSVVVSDDGRADGIFTERDVTRRIVDDAGLLKRSVGDVMTTPVIATTSGSQMIAAFETMNARGIRRLPVLEGDRLVGIVTERDLMKWVGAVAAE